MMFISSNQFIILSFFLFITSIYGWIDPLKIHGHKFFPVVSNSKEFRIKGIAYYPRPNNGELNKNSVDYFTKEYEYIWKRDIQNFVKLGINTIRIYAVDPSKNHDEFMCELSNHGIYVIVGMAATCQGCSIPKVAPPKCYESAMYDRAQKIYNAFAVYDNTLGFSVGNENNYDKGLTAPCVKALLRDIRKYAKSCSHILRRVPIGLVNADILPRSKWINYYDCKANNDPYTRAEWLGWNPYVECDPTTRTTYEKSIGYQTLVKDFKQTKYSRPVIFGEYGCIEIKNTIDGYEQQREWYQAKWLNEEPDMIDQFAGGCAFEYSVEAANIKKKISWPYQGRDSGKYGIGYFSPEKCDDMETKCTYKTYPQFDKLSKMYKTTKESTLTREAFNTMRDNIAQCPNEISADLPILSNKIDLECSAIQPKCNGKIGKGASVNEKKDGNGDDQDDQDHNQNKNSNDGNKKKDNASNASTFTKYNLIVYLFGLFSLNFLLNR